MLHKFGARISLLRTKPEMSGLVCSISQASVTTVKSEDKVKLPTQPSRRKEIMSQKYPVMNIHDAVTKIKELCWAKFDETIELSLNMNLDPRKPNQSVKGVAKLPSGTGKPIRILVFASGKDAIEAREAGADVVGSDDLVAKIQGGDVNFTTVIATPDTMGIVGKVGKILGPRGLMPNPKLGTVTREVGNAVRTAKAGTVKYKVEKKGIIQAGVGKKSFSDAALLENIRSVLLSVADAKPESLKGKYFKCAHISSSMGPSIEIDLPSVDPSNGKFMLNIAATSKQ